MNIYENIAASRGSIKTAHAITRALRHALRLQVLQLIQEKGRATVTELYVGLRMEQSVCSQHLGILRKVGIVNTERNGKMIYYSINETAVTHILETFSKLAI